MILSLTNVFSCSCLRIWQQDGEAGNKGTPFWLHSLGQHMDQRVGARSEGIVVYVDNAQISGAQVAKGTFTKRLAIEATIGDLWNVFPFVLVVLVCFSLHYDGLCFGF
jgi:hypothetical protein